MKTWITGIEDEDFNCIEAGPDIEAKSLEEAEYILLLMRDNNEVPPTYMVLGEKYDEFELGVDP